MRVHLKVTGHSYLSLLLLMSWMDSNYYAVNELCCRYCCSPNVSDALRSTYKVFSMNYTQKPISNLNSIDLKKKLRNTIILAMKVWCYGLFFPVRSKQYFSHSLSSDTKLFLLFSNGQVATGRFVTIYRIYLFVTDLGKSQKPFKYLT